jgi:phosphoribosyl 1,2-cyclic phosphodiesterase
MSLFTASLSSGSNGNCYYVGDSENAVLIDAGIAAREIEKRLRRLQLPIDRVKGIFVSHEHGDHIHGASGLAKRHAIPVYITDKTYLASGINLDSNLIRSFLPYQPVEVGTISVTAFPKFHDAVDPHSFVIRNQSVNVGVFTDIGRICEHVIHNFKKCNAVFLEANYDELMLASGPYPEALKRRIRGGLGHLSNRQAWHLFESNKSEQLSHLFLSHLSHNNNVPSLAESVFASATDTTEIIVASRRRETKLVEVVGSSLPAQVKPLQVYTQMRLF